MADEEDRRRASLPAPLTRPRLRFMTCGSVDDGKSTLIGRLLLDSGAIYEDHLSEAIRAGADTALDLSFLVDGLKAEREQGITIDVAYRYFATQRRAFLIADAPGHEQYTRNQAAAASQTDLAVLLVSVADGVQPQTRRHLAIAALFGVRDAIFAINKMDLVGYKKEPFVTVAAELRRLAAGLGINIVATIPISARAGDNVVVPSAATPWHNGPTLLDALEGFTQRPAAADSRTVLPVALTGRFDGGGRVSFGEVAAGEVFVGQRLKTDGDHVATVARLWSGGSETERAGTGEAIAAQLTPELDLGRGAVLHGEDLDISPAMQLRVRFIWLSSEPMKTGRAYDIQIGTGQASAALSRLEGRLDLNALSLTPLENGLAANDIVLARLSLTPALPALPFDQNRKLGAFILVDRTTRRTAAAGIVLSLERRAGDTPWQQMQVSVADRAHLMGQAPFVIWLTGLSGAGKSTISDLLDRKLHSLGHHAMVLDGDNLRQGLNSDLGFSEADRSENVRRVGEVAALMADAGLIAIVSLISPFRQDRARARDAVGAHRFLEVFVDAPLEVCRQRDPKGFYARAEAGSMKRFTGVSAGYEPPPQPDLHLRTDQLSVEEAVDRILATLRTRGIGEASLSKE